MGKFWLGVAVGIGACALLVGKALHRQQCENATVEAMVGIRRQDPNGWAKMMRDRIREQNRTGM